MQVPSKGLKMWIYVDLELNKKSGQKTGVWQSLVCSWDYQEGVGRWQVGGGSEQDPEDSGRQLLPILTIWLTTE